MLPGEYGDNECSYGAASPAQPGRQQMLKDPEMAPPWTSQGDNNPAGTFTLDFQLPERKTSSVVLARPTCAPL